ncbi:MAG TPA: SDR family NAD(P)-dependent oxidoreductase [Rubrobacter sp.]|nr:SDR family NAD(P)-dependent oxidoreductase [Rubrobacter sp.]
MNGRVATVLGVGPGLGAAVARRFAGEGFVVAMMARQEESLAEIRQDIEDDGGTALPFSADATNASSVAAAFERIRSDLGDPKVLVYNAGAFQMGGVLEISPAQFEECFRSNCAGTPSAWQTRNSLMSYSG